MLVAIDSRVQAYHTLATGVRSGAKVLIVDPNVDGIEQITQALAEHSASSLHIVCHGEPGTLYLGKTPLNSANLAQYRHQLQRWQVSDILLYACNVAADLTPNPLSCEEMGLEALESSNVGWVEVTKPNTNPANSASNIPSLATSVTNFLQRLHQLTKANIAASAQRVGNPKLGGSWQLECRIGNIVSSLAFLPEVCSNYPGVFLASFSKATNFQVGPGPISLALGDFNGDGNPDLVTAQTASLSVLLGTGDGSFSKATDLMFGSLSVAVGDFNGDGQQDLVGNNTGIRLGNGDGSFGNPIALPQGISSSPIAVGDFNQDKFLDLAFAVNSGVSVLSGKGDGTFNNPVNFVGGSSQTVTTVDLNGDGKLDLVTANGTSNNISVLLNQGNGSFSTPTNFAVGGNAHSIAVGDFNGDGLADLVTANMVGMAGSFSAYTNVSVLLGIGDGSFSKATDFFVRSGFNSNSPPSIAVGDFDKDGANDIAVSNGQLESKSISVLLGTGKGSFGLAADFLVGSSSSVFPIPVIVGDLNKDGKPDIATTNFSNVAVLLNTTPTPASYTVTIAPGANPSELNSTDGTFVITLDNPAPGKGVTVNYSVATGGNAATPNTDYKLVPGSNISAINANSFTIAAGASSATLKIVTVDDAVFDPNETVGITLAAGTGYTIGSANNASLTITDNDPIINISAGNAPSESGATNGTFNITLNAPTNAPFTVNFNTNGSSANIPADYTFDLAASSNITAIDPVNNTFTIAAGVSSATLAFKPVDDAVIETGGEKVRVNLAPGTGYTLGSDNSAFAQFNPPTKVLPFVSSKSVAVADFNVDGNLDLAMGYPASSVVLGKGDGSFSDPMFLGTSVPGEFLTVGDFNADGKPDLVTAAKGFSKGSLLLGKGDGRFDFSKDIELGTSISFDATEPIIVGDFNNDGTQDLFIAGSPVSSSLLWGKGDGSFVKAALSKESLPDSFNSMAAGDFNEDGVLDVARIGLPGDFRVYLGKGDGSFKNLQLPPSPLTPPLSVAVGDLNKDGHLDLITANYGNKFDPFFDTVSLRLGKGDGSFSEPSTFLIGGDLFTGFSSRPSIRVADFNGDGKQDIALANLNFDSPNKGMISVLLGNGDGTLNPATNLSAENYLFSIAAGDFNRDGNSDLVTANDLSGVSLWLNNNQPTANLTIADNDSLNIVNIVAGNNPNETGPTNGSFNITLTSPAPAGGLTVNYSLATGSNTATPGTDYQLVAGNNLTAVTATSFTIAAGATTATLNVAPVTDNAIEPNENVGITLERGTGYGLAFGNTAEVKFAPPNNSFSVDSKPFIGDFNRDGFLDLLTPGNGVGWVFFGTGNGSFDKASQSIDLGAEAFTGTGASPEYSLVTGDFNSDGNPDLASGHSKVNGGIAVVLGNGDGTFTKATHFSANSKPNSFLSLAKGDFNADGNLDLVGINDGNVSFLIGTGTGTFSAPIVSKVEAGNYFWNITAQDFNGDGKLDLLGQGQFNSVSLILGKGDGTFEKATKLLPNSAAMAVADFNSDGKFDLVTANYTGFLDKQIQASVFLGNGNGSFNDPTKFIVNLDQNPPIQSWIGSLAVSDFDGDAKLDIAVTSVANNYAADVWFLTGNGDGTFGKATKMPIGQVSSSNQLASWISAADFNGDGQSDVVTGANSPFLSSHKAFVLLNNNKPTADLTIADSDPNAKNITLAVSPSSATEDGTTNLVYTFTRTGDLTNSLSVNFIVGGSATFGSDYTQTGTAVFSETKGTITFAANSNTATLTIDPTADALIEPDESVELTLAPGTDYTIVTSTAVAGTIANDDSNNPPTVSNLNQSGNEDTDIPFSAADFTSKFTDTNGDNLTKIQVTSLPNNGLLKLIDANVTINQEISVAELGNLRFTPNPNWNGDTSFNWNGFDGKTYALSPATVNLTINPVNDAPFVSAAIPINQTAAVNGLYNFTFAENTFSDIDSGDILTYTATNGNSNSLPNWLSFNPITRSFVGIPTNSDVGKMSVLIKATDSANASTFVSFNLTVTNPIPDCFCDTIIRPDADNIPGVDTTPNPVDAIQLGSDNDDILIGTDAGDSLNGFGGNDWIFGKAGKDNLIGGADNDIIFGWSDRDYILGDSGNDFLSGNQGNDYIQGGTGNDMIRAGQGNDFANGGENDDLLFGDKGDDILNGDRGNDIVCGNIGDDTLFGNEGNDTVRGGQNDDIVFGDEGDDWLAGDRGNDSLCGGDGNDTAYGGSEDDEICGGDGNDLLFGNQGKDTLNGELGDDTLYGGKDNDTVIGGAGNDWLHGGKGEDVFMITVGWGGDAIADFTDGEDLLGLTGGLIFSQLAISQNNNDTTISVKSSGEILAILTGIASNQIGQEDFI